MPQYYPTDIEELSNYVLRNRKTFGKIVDSLHVIYNEGFKIDVNDSFNKLYLYFVSERHKANNDYLKELTSKINEWGGQVYVSTEAKKYDKEYTQTKKKIVEELKLEKLDDLQKAVDDLHKFDSVQYIQFKNKHEKLIMTVKHICNIFNLIL